MIDHITSETIGGLHACTGSPCVSLYLPTHRRGPETEQDPIRFRNVLDEARDKLKSTGMRGPDADRLLADAMALLDDDEFWQHLDDGLAVLVSDEGTRFYRLPRDVDELVVISDRLHLRPLLRSLDSGSEFYVLALSRNDVRLLRGSRSRIHEIALRDVSTDLASALWYRDPEKALQLHGANRVGTGRVAATFHGHGLGRDTSDADLRAFLRAVDGGVAEVIGEDPAPMVLAGVGELTTEYRAVSDLDNILELVVEGNPDHLSPEELHEKAWPIAEMHLDERRREIAETIEAQSPPTVNTPEEALMTALQGRVATLFVAADTHVFGRFDESTGEVEVHDAAAPGDSDLLDVAAVLTWRNRGEVHVVATPDEVPGPSPIAAVLRF